MGSLKDKIALITGSSRGLGKEMALKMAGLGAKIIVTYRANKEAAYDTVQQVNDLGSSAFAVQLDTSNVDVFDSFFKNVGETIQDMWDRVRFDILVNNAGIIAHSLAERTTEETYDELHRTHLKGPFFLTSIALPMINNNGRIINISSGLARFSMPGYSAYAAMKAGIEAYTRYLAKELGDRGITANVVAPGAINTDMNKEAMQNPEFIEMISSLTALGRVGQPDDISGVVAFLASEDAKWVNGQRIEASGGIFL